MSNKKSVQYNYKAKTYPHNNSNCTYMSFLAMKAKAVASTKRREPTTKYTIPIIRFLAPKILRNIELSPSVRVGLS